MIHCPILGISTSPFGTSLFFITKEYNRNYIHLIHLYNSSTIPILHALLKRLFMKSFSTIPFKNLNVSRDKYIRENHSWYTKIIFTGYPAIAYAIIMLVMIGFSVNWIFPIALCAFMFVWLAFVIYDRYRLNKRWETIFNTRNFIALHLEGMSDELLFEDEFYEELL